MLWLWLLLAEPIHSQSPCTRGHAGQLATVAVWVKHNDSLTTFRISDEDLTDEGFQRSPAERDVVQVQLGRQPGSCPVGLCALRLRSSRRKKDGVFLQQEDIYTLPEGYENLQDDFYCGRAYGDCGADVPIYRLTRGKGSDAIPAYSIDSTASLPGFSRDPRPICYGWSDGTGMRRPVRGDGCLKYQSVANGQINYSVEETSSLAVGTTVILHCSSGYLSTGPSSALCTRNGWNPKELGSCSKANRSTVNLLSTGSTNSAAPCTTAATVKNAQIIYSQLEHSAKLPSGTSASVLCNLGYVATATNSPKCDNGDWIGQWPSCVSAEKVQCQPMATSSGSKISYEPSENPLAIGSTATLSCPSGSSIAGATRSTCAKTGWQPKSLGICVSSKRVKRQGLPCLPLAVLGGTPNYIQANPSVPYSAGTSAIITCNAGYILQGSGSSVCSNGQWSPAPGTCILSSTGLLPGIINTGSIGGACPDLLAPLPGSGSITYSLPAASLGTHPSATVASLTCSLGTTVSGSLSATCTSGVWSPPTLGTCVASTIGGIGGVPGIGGNSLLECANPVVVNGQISYSTSSAIEPVKPVGSVATLTCNGGFIVSGIASATCQSGIWTPPLGTCNPTLGSIGSPGTGSCLLGVVPPLGATITYSNGALVGPWPSGTQARLTCPGGGVPSGSIQATCSNGQWSPSTLSCSPTGGTGSTCLAVLAPSGGNVLYSQPASFGSYNTGTTATLTCQSGTLTGSSISSCQNGAWSPTLGSCTGGIGGIGTGSGTCNMMIPPMGTTVAYSAQGPFGPFNVGTTGRITCLDPSQQLIGSSVVTCTSGQWTPSIAAASCAPSGSVSNVQCPFGISPPFGATVTYSTGSSFGPFPANSVATMQCTSGSVQGQSTSSCINGQWSPQLGTCSGSGIQCFAAVTVPSGGTVSYSGGQIFAPFSANTIATLTCSTGFVQGLSTATCSNGQWTQLGTCSGSGTGTGASCPSGIGTPVGGTVSFSNGAIFGPFPSGTTATLRCTTGTAIGSITSTCSNGVWNPSTFSTCSTTGTGTGSQCFVGATVPFGGTVTYSGGQIFAPFNSNTVATLTCTTGFVQGLSTATCSNGQWTQLGTCSSTGGTGGTSCSFGASTPIGGTVSYSNGQTFGPWPSGTTATLTCSGSLPIGASTSICTNGQWTQIGTCSGTGSAGSQCFAAVTVPSGGTVSYSGGQIFAPFNANTIATLTCITGVVQGLSTSTCSNGQWTQLGTCSGSGTGTGASCPSGIGTPIGGTVSFSNGVIFGPFPSGTTATLRCTTGTAIGSITSTCSSGVWDPPTFSTCSTTGTGQCLFAPANPTGGTLTYSTGSSFGPWLSGTTVTLTCPSGQFPQGTSTATCLNGQWTSLATSCSTNPSAGCTPFSTLASSMSGGIATYSPAPTSNIQVGSTAILICNTGFSLSGATSATCTQFGWQPTSLGFCSQTGTIGGTGISCSAQTSPSFGSVTYSTGGGFGPFPTGTTSFMSCSSGYSISGSSTSTCTNGVWSPQIGTCIFGASGSTGSQCFTGPTTVSGTVTYSNGQQFGPWNSGTTATLTCPSPTFLSSGSSFTTCANGQWSPTQLGQCSSNSGSSFSSCQAVPQIQSGTITYSNFGLAPYPEETTVTLVCQFGTQLSGLSTVTCRNGGWSPFPGLGSCLSTLRSPARFASRPALDSSLNSTGSCPPPKAPPHGEITYSEPEDHGLYSQGTTAALRCLDGFGKRGASFSTCRSGMFRPLLGSCDSEDQSLLGVCLPLQTPINGRVSYIQASVTTSLEAGSTALLDCDDGYTISGRATLSCSAEGSWLPEDGFGQCELTIR